MPVEAVVENQVRTAARLKTGSFDLDERQVVRTASGSSPLLDVLALASQSARFGQIAQVNLSSYFDAS